MALIPSNNDENVSDAMQGAWSSFARYGTPSLDVGWDPYTTDAPAVAIFDSDLEIRDEIRNGRCDALREIGIVY